MACQALVGALILNFTQLKDENIIGIFYRGESVRDHDDGSGLSQAQYVVHNELFRDIIQCTGRLI